LSFRIDSAANSGRLKATVRFDDTRRPSALRVRLRHPAKQPIRSVSVNGQSWTDFDPAKEWVQIPQPRAARYEIIASY
jgi:hypothetical protein